MDWISVEDRLPEQHHQNNGLVSHSVEVLLNTGEITDDFLINGRWVWHCKQDNVGGYPIKWREHEERI